jgi:hypothetical protein
MISKKSCFKIVGFLILSGFFLSNTSAASAATTSAPGATKCLTAEIKKMHAKAIAQMEKDIVSLKTPNADAISVYQSKLEIIWEAMHQPYCGYGSRGVSAVKHSFNKSVNKTRAEFLAAAKKK